MLMNTWKYLKQSTCEKGSDKMNNYACGKYVFETENEANAYRNEVMKQTRRVLGVFATERKVTHTFRLQKKGVSA